MASGDIVFQKNDCWIGNSAVNVGPTNVVPEKIVRWDISFRSNVGDGVELNLVLEAGFLPIWGSNNLGLPPDPTKHYDLIFKEH